MIPIEYSVAAEDLYSMDIIQSFEQIGKSNWEFTLKHEDTTYKIKIKSSETTVSKTQCTCESYQNDKMCAHVFACFFELRKQIEILKQKKNEATKERKRTTRNKTGVKISDFISKLTEQELKAFVRKYAANDKKFAASLKARFARKMINQSNESVYKSILDSIIGPIRIKDQKIGSAELRNFEYVTSELIQQYEDAISLQQYTEGFFILKAILNKGCYIHHNSKKESEKIMELIIKIHTFLDELFYCPLAPELRQKLYKFALDLAQKSYYRILDYKFNIFEILYNHKKEDDEYTWINEAAKGKNEQIGLDTMSNVYLESFLLRMEFSDGDFDSTAFLNHPLEYQNKVIDLLIKQEAFQPAIAVLEDMINERNNVSRFVKEKLIFAYSLSDNPESYKSAVYKYYVQYMNPKYIKQLKLAFEETWTDTKAEFIEKLESIENKSIRLHLLSKFYYELEDIENLMKVFISLEDLDIAMNIDDLLINSFTDEVLNSYFDKSCHVLENFVGQAASNKIRSLLNHIENVADYQLRSKLFKRIKNHYIHRPQLLKDIMSIA